MATRDEAATTGRGRIVHGAAPHPCAACPWRTANHGQPHPHGWYSKANRARLWKALRTGESMTCHPTDPDNELPPGAPAVPECAQTLECAGGLILQQREVMRFQEVTRQVEAKELPGPAFRAYGRQYRGGLTLAGLRRIVERAMFGKLAGPEMAKPDLRAPVGHDALLPWTDADEQAAVR